MESAGEVWLDLEHRCGFCSIECDKRVQIGITSGCGTHATLGILESTLCTNGAKFNLKSACKSSIKTPCTNRPIRCNVCQCVFWSYNILIHHTLNHSHLTYTDTCHPSEDEIKNVKKSN